MAEEVLRIEGVTKAYQGLRPLRLASLTLARGARVSVAGFDAPAGELLVNLVTGAVVPDQGSVWTFGRLTTDIADADDWLAWLDHFGIVSERGVLLEGATLEQNLAMPFSLEIEPVPPDVAQRVTALASECGLPAELLPVKAGELPPEVRFRAHLARAVALSPGLLLIEHPTASVAGRCAQPAGDGHGAGVRGARSGGARHHQRRALRRTCRGNEPEARCRDRESQTAEERVVQLVSRNDYFTVMVIFSDTIGLSCGMCR